MTPLFAELDLGEHRDRGWDTLAAQGFAPVRQVAIDDDWSVLRFRRREFVKGGGRR